MNGNRLSVALEESDDYQIFSDDVIQFGVEVTEATDKDTPNVHSGVYTLLKLYHPDGSLANRPVENEQVKACPNISSRQLNILHDCLKLSMNRESILKDKLAFLKLQLSNLEEVTKKKWDFVIDEDLLLSKIETLQNRLESILNTNSQLKNLSDNDHRLAVLTKEIQALQEQKELYQFEFKTIVKKSFDDKRIAEAKSQETEVKLSSSLKEIKHLEGLVNKCKAELNSADSQITFLDDELKTYKLETKKLLDEKQLYEKQVAQLKENESALNEIIKDLKLEIESHQLELKSISVFEDVLNCSKSLNNSRPTNNNSSKLIGNDLEHIPNNTHNYNQETCLLNNGKLPNSNDQQYNCTDYFNCPVTEQSSQKFLDLLNDRKLCPSGLATHTLCFAIFQLTSKLINLILFRPDLNEPKDWNAIKADKNQEILRHALAVLVMENRSLIKQMEQQSIGNSLNSINSINSANPINSMKPPTRFTSSLESNHAIIAQIQSIINNQQALIDRENEISTLTKLVNELEESFHDLRAKYGELEQKVIKKSRRDEETVRNDVQNVLESVIEKVESKITQQDYDSAVDQLNRVQVSFDRFAVR